MGKKIRLKRKSIIIIIFVLVIILIISLLLNRRPLNDKEALSLGENKYLEFLWMVDGAFNYERYNHEEFTVNGKTLENKPDFSCTYDEVKKTCQAINLEKNFYNTFANNIKMDIVYGDGVAIKWYLKNNNGYYFTNSNNCQTVRMNSKHTLKVNSITKDKIVYQVSFDDDVKSGSYQGKHHYDKEFVLVYQDRIWKISEAYYHDPCYAEYLIK
jgi:hypothetical protein